MAKIVVFRDADLIVSQTGVVLANLMFAIPICMKVLELVNGRFVRQLYASLTVCGVGRVTRTFFANESAWGRTNAMMAKSTLNIDELEESLAWTNS